LAGIKGRLPCNLGTPRWDTAKGKTVEGGDADHFSVGRKVPVLAGHAEGSWRGSVAIYTWHKLLPGFCLGMVHLELFQTKDKD
jgi:hypothetical protein